MTNPTEQLPRIWMGEETPASYWWWSISHREWDGFSRNQIGLSYCDIFVPGNQPKPTIDPSTMDELKTCKEVDWNVDTKTNH